MTTVFLSAELSGRLDEDGGAPTTEPLPLATTADPPSPMFSEAMLIAARFLRDRHRLFRRSCSSVATLCCHLAAVWQLKLALRGHTDTQGRPTDTPFTGRQHRRRRFALCAYVNAKGVALASTKGPVSQKGPSAYVDFKKVMVVRLFRCSKEKKRLIRHAHTSRLWLSKTIKHYCPKAQPKTRYRQCREYGKTG